jgi:hypothetical protein
MQRDDPFFFISWDTQLDSVKSKKSPRERREPISPRNEPLIEPKSPRERKEEKEPTSPRKISPRKQKESDRYVEPISPRGKEATRPAFVSSLTSFGGDKTEKVDKPLSPRARESSRGSLLSPRSRQKLDETAILQAKEQLARQTNALCSAITKNQIKIVEDCLQDSSIKGFINGYNTEGFTALYCAVTHGHTDIVTQVCLTHVFEISKSHNNQNIQLRYRRIYYSL